MKDKIKELVQTEGFRERAEKYLVEMAVLIGDKKISEVVSKQLLLDFLDQVKPEQINWELHNKNSRILADIVEKYLADKNEPIQEIISTDSQKAIEEVLAEPVELPKETVREFLQQEAIIQLFTNIIHDAIIGFNKKVNPLAGAMAAFGMEDQIRNFIQPFMPQVVENSAEFITADKNEQMFADLSAAVFDIVKDEKPKPYIESISASQKEKIDKLSLTLATDEVLRDHLDALARHIIENFYDEVADLRVKDAFTADPREIAGRFAPLVVTLFLPAIQEDISIQYLLDEVKMILE